MKKPRLTKKMRKKLIATVNYTKAQADMLSDEGGEALSRQRDIYDALEWISDLCRWHKAKKADK